MFIKMKRAARQYSETPKRDTFRKLSLLFGGMSYLEVRKYFRNEVNKYPRFLYRYIKLEESNSSSIEDRLTELLIDGDYWLSSSLDFNDPFDMKAQVVENINPLIKRKKMEDLVRKNAPELKGKAFDADVSRRMVIHSEKGIEPHLRKHTETCGVLCFTANPRNILMWSHYAAHHKGLVIQFDLAQDPNVFAGALPVIYPDDNSFPVYNWYSGEGAQIVNILTRKHNEWVYEEEWRIIRIGDAKKHLHIHPVAISGVVFGCRIEDGLKDKVLEVLDQRNYKGLSQVKTYQAHMHKSKYEILISRCQAI